MKKLILFILIIPSIPAAMLAQSNHEKFETAMVKNIKQLDTASSPTTFITLANNFERIGTVAKGNWQPYYYAAYCYTVLAFLSPDKSAIDPLADKAEAQLKLASELDKNNSEITTMFAMINSCRIMVDPVTRFQSKGAELFGLLEKAKAQDANNPRVYLLQARVQLRTPEAFGGGKTVAKQSAETALAKFKTFQPQNSIAPNWGEQQAKGLLESINGQ